MSKHQHLTHEDRIEIEVSLRQRHSIQQIAARLGKSRSCISREIRTRSVPSEKGAVGRIRNRCIHRHTCHKVQLCMDRPDCLRHCSACSLCNKVCGDFVEERCAKLLTAPYVCNGCADEHRCILRKRFYLHKAAQADYRHTLAESRSGANITQDELLVIDQITTPLIRQGQSVHHIMANNPDLFHIHEKTLYRYIAGGLLSAKNGDMPRVCMLKPRRRKSVEHKVDKKCRLGRTYKDYLEFQRQHPDLLTAEMDTLIGRVGGRVILTLMLPHFGFMIARIRECNNARTVAEQFAWLWQTLGPELFRIILPLLLTDNGSEFSDPLALEMAPDHTPRTHLFYCDACATNQKARIERNHELIRAILPKGTSFDHITQPMLDVIMSHVNSYSRPSLADKAPTDLFAYTFGTHVLEALGMKRIPANEIILKPKLIDQIM